MSKTQKKVKTMADIAKIAGVSPSTASRALRDSPLISQETINKVKMIAEEHAYRPHLGARNLRTKRSNVIVLILPFNYADAQVLANPYIFKIVGTIGSTLREHGYDLLLSQMDDISELIDDQYVHAGIAEGAIILGRGDNDPQKIEKLVRTGIPFVILGPMLDGQNYCSVGINNLTSSCNAVKHLGSLGRKKIAIVTDKNEPENSEINLRYQGYLNGLRAMGSTFDPNLIVDTIHSGKAVQNAVQTLLYHVPDVDAIFVSLSDVIAISVIQALRQNGKRVPEDVAVIGFDNIDLCDFTSPPLTSISQRLQDGVARLLVENLLKQIKGEPVESIMLDGKLVLRQSCGGLQAYSNAGLANPIV